MGLTDKINQYLDAKIEELAARSGDGRPPWAPGSPLPPMSEPPREPSRVHHGGRRRLEDDDIAAFMRAAEERPGVYGGGFRPTLTGAGRERFLREVRHTNPLRFARLERDINWLRREARRKGLDPEEIRWML